MQTTLIITAIAIVLVLATYAGWLHYKLWKLKKEKTAQKGQVATYDPNPGSGRKVSIEKTLYVLADALINEKMTHTEGCLRICATANNLEDIETFRKEYGVLFRVAEATAHFPILDDWQALSREEQKRYTRERKEIEDKYKDAVEEAVKRLWNDFR